MSESTYREYLEYMQLEISNTDPATLSDEEQAYYSLLEKECSEIEEIPAYMLNAAFPSEGLQNANKFQTVKSETESPVNRFEGWIAQLFKHMPENRSIVVQKMAIAAISFIVFVFSPWIYPITATVPAGVSWHKVQNAQYVTETPVPGSGLSGAAGLGEKKTETYLLEVAWNPTKLDITYLIWSLLPISTLIILVYFPAIKWALAK